ncbi:phage tail family protein [Paenibacillus sp. VCA1]|uniref:phage tail domain-containing protein n=1 Tax=Paenibacillus sp. VCA1 TaxID=3039148 RepID=UPI00287128D0|nr:phage tail domain-containing protein [Paenibacillus sp. VCA1]MDR9852890.1 phage tail family protein [Paenibacillus sp. VCA1]
MPILPGEEENTLKLAGTDGVLDFGSTYGTRTIDLTLEILTGPAEFHRTLAQLARMFNAKRGEITLEFTDMPGKYYRGVYSGTMALDGQVGSRLVNVSLRMNDPWPTGPEKVTEVTITRSPEVIPIESAADVRAQPVIVMTNTGTTTVSFKLTNEYTIE